MSRDARLMCGLALILVPPIVYGGLTLLGVLSGGAYGTPAPKGLSPSQQSFYRAGHAHAWCQVASLDSHTCRAYGVSSISVSRRSSPPPSRWALVCCERVSIFG
jgi:hypothetical protein